MPAVAALVVATLGVLVPSVAPAGSASLPPGAAATGDAACDATWHPAAPDDPRAPVGIGLSGPGAVGRGEPAVFFLRRGAEDAAAPWTLFLPTTDSFGLTVTEGTAPAGPSLSRLCLRIDDPTAIGQEFALGVGTFGPGTLLQVFRVTDPDPAAACASPYEPIGAAVPGLAAFGPVVEPPGELYPGRRNQVTVRVGGAPTGSWTLEAPDGVAGAPLGGPLTFPDGVPKGALCLDAVPAEWAGHAATLRVSATAADGTTREAVHRLWVGDAATPCDGRFRPIAAPTGPVEPLPALHGPTEVALGAPARFVFLAGGPAPLGPHAFSTLLPAPRTYDGIPTRGALLPEAAAAYELCFRPLDPAAAGQAFDLTVDGLHARFTVTDPTA